MHTNHIKPTYLQLSRSQLFPAKPLLSYSPCERTGDSPGVTPSHCLKSGETALQVPFPAGIQVNWLLHPNGHWWGELAA